MTWTASMSPLLMLVPALALAGPDGFQAFDGEPQSATPSDMQIMHPYIGTFRSKDYTFDDSETDYHFEIAYEWFDSEQTIVQWTVTMVIPEQQRRLVNGQGYYGYDAFDGQIYVFGAFTRGVTGWGAMGRFDADSGAREIWARSRDAEGLDTFVRDRFELLDDKRWRNETWLRTGDETEWKKVHEGVYTRIDT